MDTIEENYTGQCSYFHFLPWLLLYCCLGILILSRQICRHSAGHDSYENVTELNLSSTLAASKLLTQCSVYTSSCLSGSMCEEEMVTLKGKCALGAFNKCSGMCAEKQHLRDYLIFFFFGRAYGTENPSCPLQLLAAYEYHCTELTPSTL